MPLRCGSLIRAAISAKVVRAHVIAESRGPASLAVLADSADEQLAIAGLLSGQLTATVHAERGEGVSVLVETLSRHAGRVIWNGWPTGVTVSYAPQHGGPFPAATGPLHQRVRLGSGFRHLIAHDNSIRMSRRTRCPECVVCTRRGARRRARPGTAARRAAIGRFLRSVAYQDMPEESLPPALQSGNPWGIARRVDGKVIVA